MTRTKGAPPHSTLSLSLSQVLLLSAKELRSQFAYLTEKVQEMVGSGGGKAPAARAPGADVDKERELQATVAKVSLRALGRFG